MKSPAWLAGYAAGMDCAPGVAVMEPPSDLTGTDRSHWISGFLCGVRDADDVRLMREFEEGAET